MSNINKRLSELSPHVLGIRFTKGIAVIDTFFKDGWSIPKSEIVGHEAIPQRDNIYMLWPQNEEVGVEEMLDYVSYVIKVNIEREQKIELLQVKINELKQIFTKSSLSKCKTLKFSFEETDYLMPSIDSDNDVDLPILTRENTEDKNVITEDDLNDVPVAEVPKNDSEVENFNRTARVNNETFDLPPKKGGKIEVQNFEEPEVICKCDPNDPNQACPKCYENKF